MGNSYLINTDLKRGKESAEYLNNTIRSVLTRPPKRKHSNSPIIFRSLL